MLRRLLGELEFPLFHRQVADSRYPCQTIQQGVMNSRNQSDLDEGCIFGIPGFGGLDVIPEIVGICVCQIGSIIAV